MKISGDAVDDDRTEPFKYFCARHHFAVRIDLYHLD